MIFKIYVDETCILVIESELKKGTSVVLAIPEREGPEDAVLETLDLIK